MLADAVKAGLSTLLCARLQTLRMPAHPSLTRRRSTLGLPSYYALRGNNRIAASTQRSATALTASGVCALGVVALSNMDNCLQVRRAQDAGAAAVIVYDDVYEALIIMAKPLGNPDPDIPAVFVSQKSGIVMRKLVSTGLTIAQITPVSCCVTTRAQDVHLTES